MLTIAVAEQMMNSLMIVHAVTAPLKVVFLKVIVVAWTVNLTAKVRVMKTMKLMSSLMQNMKMLLLHCVVPFVLSWSLSAAAACLSLV